VPSDNIVLLRGFSLVFADRSQNAKLADWGGMQQLTEESPATGLFPAKGAFSYRCRKTQQLLRVKIGIMGEIAVFFRYFRIFRGSGMFMFRVIFLWERLSAANIAPEGDA